ncbi:MAG TPA: DUF1835 domain-containing protein [Pyrinomonadaceae bacterium]
MLHIHNGDSSADTAKKARIPGEHLAWREALVCGPAPAGLSANEFRQVRAQHLAEAYDIKIEECEGELARQEKALEGFGDHEEVVLWFEHDLFCQVQLVYLLNWFAQRERGATKLSLICIDRFPGVDDFRGLGQLSEPQLESLLPQREEISEAQLQLGANAWAAYSSSTPAPLEELISGKTDALPFLKTAFAKHLERFPSVRNGLGRIENVLLELLAAGPREFKSLFFAFLQREPIYGFGDTQILLHLKRLANARPALLTMSKGNSDEPGETSFEIPEQGKRVLSGEDDCVLLDGIDLWLGGVHLRGETSAWRWEDATGKLVSGFAT